MPDRKAPQTDQDTLLQLQLIPLFSRIQPKDMLVLLANSETRSLPSGTLLFERGRPVLSLFVLLSGEVELSCETDGQPCVVDICRPGAIMGEAAIFSHDPSELTARTLAPSTVLAFPAPDLLAMLESRFDLQLHVLSVLSLRLRGQVKQIAELKLKTTAQRLGIYLLALTNQSSGSARIELPYDKKRIADELGMQPESLSRSLAKLGRQGVESLPGNIVQIEDIALLRQFCITDD
ncbi:MAG: cyclic nucleotide-binding domain-containing protein [Rhodospirillales bacterium]|nr:MAG: cyclic nucleotide-binding domain-containing protein [Rhodospirillales bacterium]